MILAHIIQTIELPILIADNGDNWIIIVIAFHDVARLLPPSIPG